MSKLFSRWKSDALSLLPFHRMADRAFRKKVGLTGKNIKKKIGLAPVSSAGSYDVFSQGVYGHTGSIVGRY